MSKIENEEIILHKLVHLARQKDYNKSQKAFTEILKYFQTDLNKIANKFFINGSDTEDVIQEARIGLWKAVLDWDANAGMSFRNFALSLCCQRNVLTAIMTANRKKNQILNDSISYDVPINTIDENAEQSLADFMEDVNSDLLYNMIKKEEFDYFNNELYKKLTKLEWDIYHYYKKNYSYEEIAILLNIKTKAVDNALVRIRKKALEVTQVLEMQSQQDA